MTVLTKMKTTEDDERWIMDRKLPFHPQQLNLLCQSAI
jgi:hypothetical protein